SKGEDRAWLGGMTFLPVAPLSVQVVPQNPTAHEGERVVLRAMVSGTGPFTYQWFFNGNWLRATNSTLVIDSATMDSSGNYSVSVRDPASMVASAQSHLIVKPAVEGQRVMLGSPARMVFNTRPPAPATYFWYTYYNGGVKDGGGNYGATTPMLTIGKDNVYQDTYVATETTRSGWTFTGFGALVLEQPGTVVGWGFDESENEIAVPDGLDNVVSISMANHNGVAVLADGTVRLLGVLPQILPDDWTNITAAAAGEGFTLVLKSDGTVSLTKPEFYSDPPMPPTDLSDVVGISARGSHWIAVKRDGTVAAWSLDTSGELTTPTDLGDVVSVSAGNAHNLALKRDGTIVAWGNDDDGQIIVPATARDVRAIAAGDSHSLALRRDGTVVAWGDNTYGQTSVPAGLKNVIAIAAGATHSVALKADGTVVTWGGYEKYDRTIANTTVPQGLRNIAAIGTGPWATYAITYAPTVTVSPLELAGRQVMLAATAHGRSPMTYQWRLNGRNITAAADIQLQVAEPTSTVAAARLKYDVVVHNAYGTTTSAPAVLPVAAPSDGSVSVIELNPPPINFIPPPPDPGDGTIGPLQSPIVVPNGLQLMRVGHDMVLIWPDIPGAVLESTDDITRGFSQDDSAPSSSRGMKLLRVMPNTSQRFYRLRQN
ncbi:MAG: immunoglobulin domain-containing protein, partial [Limisphaerales bacterium]